MKTLKLAVIAATLLLLILLPPIPKAQAEPAKVLVVEIDGPITSGTVELIREALEEADDGYEALVLRLNTPGGGLKETFQIVDLIERAKVPVIGYVHPQGARAWSAGTFILLSTDVAAMTPHTIIGSCQPVEVTQEGTKHVTSSKEINALVKFLEERAAYHHRNVSIMRRFVRENLNLNATEAKTHNVTEVVSSSIDDLLTQIDGMRVPTLNTPLHTSNATIVDYTPSVKVRFLTILSNPILASLLFIVGIYALIFGISTPGYGAEIFGVIAICLGIIGVGFQLNYVALFIVAFGAALLLAELFFIPGFGVAGVGGIICLVIGSIFLVPLTYPRWLITEEYQYMLIMLLLLPTVLVGIFFGFAFFKVLRIRKKKPVVGEFVGEEAESIDELIPGKEGFVRFKGEYWKARAEEQIRPGEKVVIVKKEGTVLVVKKP